MEFKITKPVRLIELFGGIGSQAMALRDLGVNFEHYRLIEWDKYCLKSYNAIHGTDFTTSDITQIGGGDLGIIDTDKYEYIMTYSFPCQDLSLAGKQKGMEKGSGTRSGLLWQVERLLNEVKNLPQVLLMENVTQVHGKKNKSDFDKWIKFLESKGYHNYIQDLNAKNYGVAQNRDRCFMVSLLSDDEYVFPEPIELKTRLKDYLEDTVDEKYYINNEKAQKLIVSLIERGVLTERERERGAESTSQIYGEQFGTGFAGNVWDSDGLCPTIKNESGGGGGRQPMIVENAISTNGTEVSGTIRATYYKNGVRNIEENVVRGLGYEGVIEPQIVAMRGRNPENPSNRTAGIPTEQRLEPNSNGLSNCLTSVQKDNLVLESQDKIRIRQATKKGYAECDIGGCADLSYPGSKTRRGRVQEGGHVSPTITANETGIHYFENAYRIRKLTPRECWRLMSFSDEDFNKAAEQNSNTQLYKQAGNSIVENVLVAIFGQMFKGGEKIYEYI